MRIKLFAILLLMAMDAAAVPLLGVRLRTEHRTDAVIGNLVANGFKTVRMGATQTSLTEQHDFFKKLRENGITAQVTVQPTFQNDHSCNQNYTAIHDDAYNDTIEIVNALRDVVYDYEILNEIPLRSEITNQCAWNSQQGSTACYAASTCMATAIAAMNGIEEAIHNRSTQNQADGRPALRTILGALGRDWGFINYATNQGVVHEVIGFHMYQANSATSVATDSWYYNVGGQTGIVPMLAQFNKPVTINETNCGEIYLVSWDNTRGSSSLATCQQAIAKHMVPLLKQTTLNIESVVVYELYDDESKSGAEAVFGLLYPDGTQKNTLNMYKSLFGSRTPTGF